MLTPEPPWGSRSTTKARFSRAAKPAAKLSVLVVLATPPFWFAMAIILVPLATRLIRFSMASLGMRYSRPIFVEGSLPLLIQRATVLLWTFRSFATSSVERYVFSAISVVLYLMFGNGRNYIISNTNRYYM